MTSREQNNDLVVLGAFLQYPQSELKLRRGGRCVAVFWTRESIMYDTYVTLILTDSCFLTVGVKTYQV